MLDRRDAARRSRAEGRLPGAGDLRRARPDHPAPRRPGAGEAHRREARHRQGRRPLPAGAPAGRGQPGAARARRGGRARRPRPDGPPPRRPQAGPVHLLADRARPRAARRRDRARAARAGPGPRGRLARAEPGHPRAGGRGRAHPSGQPAPRQRVAPHGVGVRRARPALLPGVPPHGRDPGRQLHALPRRRAATSATTSGSATRRGSSTTTCTRTRARSGRRTPG